MRTNLHKLLSSFAFLLISLFSQGQSTGSLAFSFSDANQLYKSGDYQDAISQFVSLQKKYEDKEYVDSLCLVLNRLGTIHSKLGSQELALSYLRQATNYFPSLNDNKIKGDVLNNLGISFYKLNHLDSARYFWDKSESEYLSGSVEERLILTSINRGSLFINSQRTDLAEKTFLYLMNSQPYDSLVQTVVPLNLGIVYLNQNKYDSALTYLSSAKVNCERLRKDEYLLPCLLNLGHLYYNMEDYKTSNDYYEAYHELKDSLYNAEISVTIEELENQFELEKEKLALADKELEALRWERTAIAIALVLLLLLTAGVLWYRNRKKVEQARSEAMFEAREKENKRIADLLWKEIGESSKEGKLLLSGQELPENTIPGAIAAARFLSNQQFNPFLAVSLKKALEHLVESLSKRHQIQLSGEIADVQVPMKARAKHYRAIEKLLLFIVQSKGTSEITFKLAEEGAGWIASFSTDGELNEKDAIWPLSKALVKRIDGKVKLQAQSNTNQIIAKANTH